MGKKVSRKIAKALERMENVAIQAKELERTRRRNEIQRNLRLVEDGAIQHAQAGECTFLYLKSNSRNLMSLLLD